MTLVFDKGTKRPGTHVLIVASGDVPRYPKAGSGAPIRTARALADWLIRNFRHPGAQLASIEILASAPAGEDIGYKPPDGIVPFTFEPPRVDTLRSALERWRRRLDFDARNIALFYYSGYVFRTPETLLLLQDFGVGTGAGGALSFPSLPRAMAGCRAGRRLYVVDGLPLEYGSAVAAQQPRSLAAPAARDLAAVAVIQGETAAGESDSITAFSRAFMRVLDRPDGSHAVSVRDVIERLPQALEGAAGRTLGSQFTGDFDLHYPRFEAESSIDFVADDPEAERDMLGRSVLAIGLARRLHKIWRHANGPAAPAGAEERAAFVVHLDAPWGGGKTSFANFLGRVLNPCPRRGRPAGFLTDRYPDEDLSGMFLEDPPADGKAAAALAGLPGNWRRPWIVVSFNAWQAEHCAPPWWVFYQAIRTGCLDAIWREGDLACRPRAPARGVAARIGNWLDRRWRGALAALRGKDRWLALVCREYGWRLLNPKILSLLVTAGISLVLVALLIWSGAWGLTGTGSETGAGFILSSGLGLFFAALTGVTAVWGLGALFTESIIPGTDTLAERLSLGSGDPFARFRAHFADTMAGVRRPVMVVVDDLDRCRPDFVVDLVRGIQTLLRSPRVVFVILGDRDWIERAFEAHHEAMREVDVGPEQTFGARFVEKAIQMSFILPALSDASRRGYVRRVLLGDRAGAAAARAPIEEKAAARVREIVNRAAAAPDADPFATAPIVERVRTELARTTKGATLSVGGVSISLSLEQMVSDTLAIRATTDEAVEREVLHELQQLAACFPANPRQIKRIVNAVTIYYAVALQRPGLVPDEAFREQLALWVIVMTEWPGTWRLLASFPDLVDILTAENADEAMKRPGVSLPGSVEATAREVERIAADAELMALITGKDEGAAYASRPALETGYVKILNQLTPLHSRKRRLADEPEPAEGAPGRAGAAPAAPAPPSDPPSAATPEPRRRRAAQPKAAAKAAAKVPAKGPAKAAAKVPANAPVKAKPPGPRPLADAAAKAKPARK